jgi:hypothetical protein
MVSGDPMTEKKIKSDPAPKTGHANYPASKSLSGVPEKPLRN